MAFIGEWLRRLGYLVRRRKMEDDLRREMETHRAMMGEPQAFGNTLRLRDEARDAWGWRWLDELTQDLRFAWRTLRSSPGFTLTAIVTLAFGIGVNTGMFSFVNGLLLRPLYERADEVVSVYGRGTTSERRMRGVSYPNYLDLRDGTTTIFANLAASATTFVGLDAGQGAQRTLASGVTANYFPMFGQPLALGRNFTPEETKPGGDMHVAVMSHALWERRGASRNILGQTVRVNGESFTVIGVTVEGFTGTSIPGPEIWVPVGALAKLDARDAHNLEVVGRLREGVALENVAPVVATMARRLEQAFPAINAGYTLEASRPWRLLFMPGPGSGAITATLSVLLMMMPAIVLLVACLNLADLLLARGHVRRQELAVRSSLGGGRGRLTRQLLTEGLLLSLAGGAAGLWLSTWATGALLSSLHQVLPAAVTLPTIDIDWRVLVGTMGFSLMASLVFGAWPAWSLTGRAIVVTDLKRQVGEEGRQPGGIRVGTALVVTQVALSLVLLVSSGLFLMSAFAAVTADPGFRVEGGVLVEVDPTLAGYDEARARDFHLTLLERVRALPGVSTATTGSSFPFNSFGDSRFVAPAGSSTRANAVDAVFMVVGRDYAGTLGLPMQSGRDFTDAELSSGSTERVAIIDDVLAQRLWPTDSALGRSIQLFEGEGPATTAPLRVIGIMPAVKHSLGTPRPFPHVYVPLGQHNTAAMTLQLRVDGADGRAMLPTIARLVRDLDAQVPILRLRTWRDDLDASVEVLVLRSGAAVCAMFGGIALLLAVIGVYGVKSYVVSRRTREFGIRIATGARPRTLVWQVLRDGSRTTAIGIGIGLLLAVGAGQLLQGILYGVNGLEPVVFIAAPFALIASSLLASLVPALRATRVDPTIALRAE